MSDLTTVPMSMCSSNRHACVKVAGSRGETYKVTFGTARPGARYQYDWSCTCKGFQFRGTCKHIKQAQPQRCGWHQQVDGGEADNGKCPCCGGDAEIVLVGV